MNELSIDPRMALEEIKLYSERRYIYMHESAFSTLTLPSFNRHPNCQLPPGLSQIGETTIHCGSELRHLVVVIDADGVF